MGVGLSGVWGEGQLGAHLLGGPSWGGELGWGLGWVGGVVGGGAGHGGGLGGRDGKGPTIWGGVRGGVVPSQPRTALRPRPPQSTLTVPTPAAPCPCPSRHINPQPPPQNTLPKHPKHPPNTCSLLTLPNRPNTPPPNTPPKKTPSPETPPPTPQPPHLLPVAYCVPHHQGDVLHGLWGGGGLVVFVSPFQCSVWHWGGVLGEGVFLGRVGGQGGSGLGEAGGDGVTSGDHPHHRPPG